MERCEKIWILVGFEKLERFGRVLKSKSKIKSSLKASDKLDII
jgi:hypothetical protein